MCIKRKTQHVRYGASNCSAHYTNTHNEFAKTRLFLALKKFKTSTHVWCGTGKNPTTLENKQTRNKKWGKRTKEAIKGRPVRKREAYLFAQSCAIIRINVSVCVFGVADFFLFFSTCSSRALSLRLQWLCAYFCSVYILYSVFYIYTSVRLMIAVRTKRIFQRHAFQRGLWLWLFAFSCSTRNFLEFSFGFFHYIHHGASN